MKKIFQNINGFTFKTEQQAREYYGNRFESALKNSILFRFILDEDGDVVGEW